VRELGGKKVSRILIVDDAKFLRETLKKILSNGHYSIVGEAKNGLEAVRLYKKLRPDLVIMDITMPEMSGIDAMKEIRKEDPDAKIIMCSAIGQQRVVFEAIEAGAKDFLVKPFDEMRVLQAVKHVLNYN
jgi:two-component system chemotaxis response regulator CheY